MSWTSHIHVTLINTYLGPVIKLQYNTHLFDDLNNESYSHDIPGTPFTDMD